jgi:hypothetical protein
LKDVEAEAELKVRLENTYNILDRTLTTLDENPKILEGVVDTAGSAVEQTGKIGEQATKPGGAVSELTTSVGDSLGDLTSSIRNSLSSVAQRANPKQLTSGPGTERGVSRAPKYDGSQHRRCGLRRAVTSRGKS